MRNRWEGKDDDIDAPVPVTERELKSLRAKARWGVVGLVLVLLVIAAGAYAMVAGPSSIRDIRAKLGLAPTSSATAEPAPADLSPRTASAGPSDSLGMPPPTKPDSTPPAKPAGP